MASIPMAQPAHAQPAPRNGTYADYLALLDDGKRYEIIDGVLYRANAYTCEHQYVAMMLSRALINHGLERKLGIMLAAPFEVHIAEDARPVQLDLLFIASARQPKEGAKFFAGALDLIGKVISSASLWQDRVIKFNAYEKASVAEYWIVDPKTRAIEMLILGKVETEEAEYALLGSYGLGEGVRSSVLPGIDLSIETLFVSA